MMAGVFIAVPMLAQANETYYHPLVREGVKWVNHSQYVYTGADYYFGPIEKYVYELSGDTVFTTSAGTLTYKIVKGAPGVFLRESDKKVYVIDEQESGNEYLLYDFSLSDCATVSSPDGECRTFGYCSTIDIDGMQCRVFKDSDQSMYGWGYLIESIGLVSASDGDLIRPRWERITGGEYNYGLGHLEDLEGNIIYKSPSYQEPAHCQPLVREGVVWHYAYEDFELDAQGSPIDSTYRMVDQKIQFVGDTTIYGVSFKKCYFYDTDKLPVDAQPVKLAREDNGKVIFAPVDVKSSDHYDDPFDYCPEGCIPGPYGDIMGEYIVYDFGDMHEFIRKVNEMWNGKYILNATDTLTMSGVNVLSYSLNHFKCVESVGADGEHVGYLDAPIINIPDCICPGVLGLAMLTDLGGNILYKGTYYDVLHQSKVDLNNDGEIDIRDVNIAINAMLGKSAAAADVNGDGACDIADVNAVINAMLGKQ